MLYKYPLYNYYSMLHLHYMKHVLYIESAEKAGGSSESLLLTIKNLDTTQYRPYVVFLNETYYVHKLQKMGVPTFVLNNPLYTRRFNTLRKIYVYLLKGISKYLPSFYIPAFYLLHNTTIRNLEKIVKEQNIGIIHLNISIARDLFGVFVSAKARIPCISHIRSAKMLSFPKPAQHFANKHVCRYIAITNFIKTVWTRLGIDKSRCTTILNGIEPLPFTPRTYSSISSKKEVTFCTVGRLIGWKNHSWLLKSFKEVLKTKPHARLIIIGSGPKRDELEAETQQYDIAQNVTFTGEVESPYALMEKADIFVFPSRKEPFGRAVLEAMSLGMPIIASDSGGIPEFIKNHTNGLLIPLNDVQALANAMLKLSSDGALCDKLSQHARKYSKDHLTIQNTVQKIEHIYDKCECSHITIADKPR
ncbi:MAG: glycosyltransferase family 4 protein [Candidatus Paceibacterota bacterium]